MANANGKPAASKSTFWIFNLIGLLLMFGFGKVVQPFGPVNELGVSVIGVFLGVIFMSLFTDQMFYVSLMGMAALVYSGYLTAASACASFLGSTTVTQLIFVTALCGGLRATGAMNVVAKKLLTAKVLKGRPQLFVTVFLLVSYFVAMFVTFVPGCLLMFTLLESIRDVAGYDKNDKFIKCMLLGIYISSMGAYALPFIGIQMTSIAMIRTSLEAFGLPYLDSTYFLSNLFIFVVFILIYSFMIRIVFRCDLEPLRTMDITTSEELQKTPDRIGKKGWLFLGAFLFCVVYNILCSVVPKDLSFYSTFFGLGGTWMWIAMIAILTVVRVDGERVTTGQQLLKDGVLWNLVFLVGIFSILGSAMTNEDIGIRTWLIQMIGPLFGNASLPLMVAMVAVIVTAATNVVNGLPCVLATVAVVMPFVAQLAIDTGINPGVMGTIINSCANMAFLTYSGSVFASLILGRDEIDQKFIWSKGLITLIVFVVVVIVMGTILSYVM